ncbi:hypothetical protein HRbin06_00015 [archaeon HR06]|nr:hypothetical protein HRbin06_00015 [archaeon HR06]
MSIYQVKLPLKPPEAIPGFEWIFLIILLVTMGLMYWGLYVYIKKLVPKVRSMTKEQREGILKGMYFLPEKLPKWMNPRIWEIAMLILVIALLVAFW